MKKGMIFENYKGNRHKLTRVSKTGIRLTATCLRSGLEFIFDWHQHSCKYIKRHTRCEELGDLVSE